MTRESVRAVVRGSGFLFLWLIAILLAPLLVLAAASAHLVWQSEFFRIVTNYLFFGSQYVFGLDEFVRPIPGGFRPLVGHTLAEVITAVGWISVALVFGWFTRRMRPILSLVCAGLVVVVLTVCAHVVLGGFGYAIQLDGP